PRNDSRGFAPDPKWLFLSEACHCLSLALQRSLSLRARASRNVSAGVVVARSSFKRRLSLRGPGAGLPGRLRIRAHRARTEPVIARPARAGRSNLATPAERYRSRGTVAVTNQPAAHPRYRPPC